MFHHLKGNIFRERGPIGIHNPSGNDFERRFTF